MNHRIGQPGNSTVAIIKKKEKIGLELITAQILLFYFYKHTKNTHNYYCSKSVFFCHHIDNK